MPAPPIKDPRFINIAPLSSFTVPNYHFKQVGSHRSTFEYKGGHHHQRILCALWDATDNYHRSKYPVEVGAFHNSCAFSRYIAYSNHSVSSSSKRTYRKVSLDVQGRFNAQSAHYMTATITNGNVGNNDLRTCFKEDLQASPAKMLYGSTLCIPGDFFVTSSAYVDPFSFVGKLKEFFNLIKPVPVTSAVGLFNSKISLAVSSSTSEYILVERS